MPTIGTDCHITLAHAAIDFGRALRLPGGGGWRHPRGRHPDRARGEHGWRNARVGLRGYPARRSRPQPGWLRPRRHPRRGLRPVAALPRPARGAGDDLARRRAHQPGRAGLHRRRAPPARSRRGQVPVQQRRQLFPARRPRAAGAVHLGRPAHLGDQLLALIAAPLPSPFTGRWQGEGDKEFR